MSLPYPFFLSKNSENSVKVWRDLGTVLVAVWCKLLEFVLASKALPRFTADENLILCNLGQWCQLSTSQCPGMVRPGCAAQGGTPSERSPKGALVQHRRQGARNPGRYRLFPAVMLECVCITAQTEPAPGWLVYYRCKTTFDTPTALCCIYTDKPPRG